MIKCRNVLKYSTMQKRLTFFIPIELHTAVKVESAKRQQSMTEFILAAIKRELAQPTATQDTHAVYAADGDG